MNLTILYFASLREALGIDREAVELPAEVTTVDELRAWLRERGGIWAQALAPGRAVRASVERRMVGGTGLLTEGAEVAFFPPVTGG